VFTNSAGTRGISRRKACSEETELKVPELVGHSTLKPPRWAADAQDFLQTNHAPRAQENKQVEGARHSTKLYCPIVFCIRHKCIFNLLQTPNLLVQTPRNAIIPMPLISGLTPIMSHLNKCSPLLRSLIAITRRRIVRRLRRVILLAIVITP
jgi:hypothetical protein